MDRVGADALRRSERAIAALHHRGPDGTGSWQSNDGQVTLSHARLSTIDLLSGSQPIQNEDGTIVAVVNGEFYGFAEIRRQLEGLGHTFRTRTDSEVLVHLYERHGTSCLERLQGEFAFVLWDEREKALFAARDRFGVRPLYYSELRNGVIFSSEVKGLKQAGVLLEWDEQGFFDKFVFQACLGGRTMYRGVCELPPAHYFLLKNGHTSVRQYWDLCYPLAEDSVQEQTEQVYAGQLKELLNEAVKDRMRADVPVACYLSSGIDSNSVLGLMARHSGSSVPAFCSSFDDPRFDEFDLAAKSAERFGADLRKVPVSNASLASDFGRTIWHCETLIENANAVAKFALSRAVQTAGYRVVLTGDGSDEVFAGYALFIVDHLRHGSAIELADLRKQLGVSAEGLQDLMNPKERATPVTLACRLGYFPAWMERRHWILGEFAPMFRGCIGTQDIDARLLDTLDVRTQLNGRMVLNQSLYIHAKTSLVGVTLSSLGDRVDMAHSVESRLPFLDHRVVEFARKLPCSQKIRRGAEKFVLRKAMRSVVAPEVCGRRKQPLAAPPALTDGKSPLGQLLQDVLRSSALERIPFLEKRATRGLLDRMLAMNVESRRGLDTSLTALASACVLAEQFSL